MVATIYRCDRCGAEAEFRDFRDVSVLTRDEGTAERHELCPACADELREWLEPEPELDPDITEFLGSVKQLVHLPDGSILNIPPTITLDDYVPEREPYRGQQH